MPRRVFDPRTGEVTAGPPPRPLPKVLLIEEADGSVWAVGTTRSGESATEGLCRQLLEGHRTARRWPPDWAARDARSTARGDGGAAHRPHLPRSRR